MHSLFFQTVFAAAATIVSGDAILLKNKIHDYLIFSLLMTLLIYPISSWVWNAGGWLAKMGFTDLPVQV
jgi:Amt family ammonium transporter